MVTTFEALEGTEKNDHDRILGDLGQVNLHLVDLIRDGLIEPSMKVFENGCGYGHNIRFFIKHGYNAFGTDPSDEAIQLIKEYLPGWNSSLRSSNFQVADHSNLPFDDNYFDFSYALHFSDTIKGPDNLLTPIKEALRVIKPSGILFLQLDTNIGLEGKLLHLAGNKYLLQDGREKILLSENDLNNIINSLNLKLLTHACTWVQRNKCSNTYLTLIKN